MIQRKQTLFLVIAAIIGALLFLLPLGTKNGDDLMLTHQGQEITLIALIFFNFLNMFLFKKREWQIRLGLFTVLITFAFSAWLFYYGLSFNDFTMGIGLFLPPLMAISTIIAVSLIRKDERLVRSMDRLR